MHRHRELDIKLLQQKQNQEFETLKKTAYTLVKNSKQRKEEFQLTKLDMFKQFCIEYKPFQEFQQKYELSGNVLGGGSYGYVQELRVKNPDPQNQEKLCVKVLRFNNGSNTQESQEKELIALQHLKILPEKYRRFVIEMKEVYCEANKIYMVIPQAVNSFNDDIYNNRLNKKNYYAPDDLCFKLSCVLLGLLAIESVGLIHRDVKPQNMLIMQDGSLILADYGTAKKLDNLMSIQTGTPSYFSPEIVMTYGSHKNKEHNQSQTSIQEYKANDLYAIGQTFVLAASLIKAPSAEQSSTWFYNYNYERKLWLEKAIQQMRQDQKYSENFIDLLERMVEQNPEYRYTLQQCLDVVEGLPDWDNKGI